MIHPRPPPWSLLAPSFLSRGPLLAFSASTSTSSSLLPPPSSRGQKNRRARPLTSLGLRACRRVLYSKVVFLVGPNNPIRIPALSHVRVWLCACACACTRRHDTFGCDLPLSPFAQWPVCVPCAGRVLRNKSEKNATTTQERPNKERNKKLCSIIVTRATTNLHHASSDAGGAARAARTAGGFAADACHGSCGGSRAVNSDDVAVVKGAVWSRVAA